MNWNDLRLRLRALLFRRRVETELREELDFHLEMQKRKNLRAGMQSGEAEREARIRFGGVDKFSEQCRDERRVNLFESVAQDVKYAVRQFRHSKAFTFVALLSLGLGIGANAALFTVFDTLYFRKVPAGRPEELISLGWRGFGERNPFIPSKVFGNLFATDSQSGSAYTTSTSFQLRTLVDFQQSGAPAQFFAFTPLSASAVIRGYPQEIRTQLVSGNYFPALGVSTATGRLLLPSDDNATAEPAAVISDFAWQKFFNREPSAIGEKVRVNGMTATIVGIAPPGFYLTGGVLPDFSLPLAFAPRLSQGVLAQPDMWWVRLMARMNEGTTIPQLEAKLQGVFQAGVMGSAPPASSDLTGQLRLEIVDGSRGFVDVVRPAQQQMLLVTVSAVFALLLLIVCLNVGNLLTARGAARDYEMSMRLAIGASRRRLIRQLLTESVVLAGAGGAVGLMVAYWGKELLRTHFGAQIPLPINWRVMLFSSVVAVTAGILFGLVPAFQATRSSISETAKRSGRNSSRPRTKLNRSLIVVQVAMSVVLLIGAGLLIRTVGNWQRVDMGFNPDGLVLFEVPPGDAAQDPKLLYARMAERIAAIPGVTGVTVAGCFPPSSCGSDVRLADQTSQGPNVQARRLVVEPGFFPTVGISLLAGRHFDARDVAAGQRVTLIDEAMARRLFPDSNPVGRHLTFGLPPNRQELEIVGIVTNAVIDIGRAELRPTLYMPVSQTPAGFGMGFIIRTATDPKTTIPAVRQAVADIDPALPLFGLTTFKQLVESELSRQRQLTTTWTLFGATALLLTGIGLYGLMSYTVARRVNEIGVRIALGARRGQVLRLIMRRMLGLVVAGLIAGYATSLAFNQVLWAFVFGVRAFDPLTFSIVAVVVSAVAAIATYFPARRASRIDPVSALRCE